MDSNLIASFQIADWSSWITAIATVILAFLTGLYVRLTYKILKAQSEPCVIMSVMPDPISPTELQLVIRNVGRGLAHDITFKPSKPIPLCSPSTSTFFDSGPIIDGIPALGPGEERRLVWGEHNDLWVRLNGEPIIVECRFRDKGKLMPPMVCKLEINSFVGTSCIQPTFKLAKDLERIANALEGIEKGNANAK